MNFYNELIKKCLYFRKSFSAGKIGETEGRNILRILKSGKIAITPDLEINAGVFPLDHQSVKMWVEEYLTSLKSLDLILQWGEFDAPLIERYAKNALVCNRFNDIQPFVYGQDGWHYELSGLRVCVVHPMKSTIFEQFQHFSKLWPGANPFDLVCIIKSPYPPAIEPNTRFSSYQQALAEMKTILSNTDFDVCIIGAGAYSLPLCAHAKSLGRIAIHLGGATQHLFGIRGSRWDAWVGPDGTWEGYYGSSKYWRHPLSSDIPQQARLVEGGCYW